MSNCLCLRRWCPVVDSYLNIVDLISAFRVNSTELKIKPILKFKALIIKEQSFMTSVHG